MTEFTPPEGTALLANDTTLDDFSRAYAIAVMDGSPMVNPVFETVVVIEVEPYTPQAAMRQLRISYHATHTWVGEQ